MPGYDLKEFAGHVGGKAGNGLAGDIDPFRMGPRHTDQLFAAGVRIERAKKLRLFSAHYVRRILPALGKARQDANVARFPRYTDSTPREGAERSGYLDIAGFDPALACACNSAHDHRKHGG